MNPESAPETENSPGQKLARVYPEGKAEKPKKLTEGVVIQLDSKRPRPTVKDRAKSLVEERRKAGVNEKQQWEHLMGQLNQNVEDRRENVSAQLEAGDKVDQHTKARADELKNEERLIQAQLNSVINTSASERVIDLLTRTSMDHQAIRKSLDNQIATLKKKIEVEEGSIEVLDMELKRVEKELEVLTEFAKNPQKMRELRFEELPDSAISEFDPLKDTSTVEWNTYQRLLKELAGLQTERAGLSPIPWKDRAGKTRLDGLMKKKSAEILLAKQLHGNAVREQSLAKHDLKKDEVAPSVKKEIGDIAIKNAWDRYNSLKAGLKTFEDERAKAGLWSRFTSRGELVEMTRKVDQAKDMHGSLVRKKSLQKDIAIDVV